MSDNKDRRDFLKIAAVGVVAGPLLMKEVSAADTIRFNPKARAVLPSGQLADRRAILKQLGLNPNTPADAWLVITKCGSNAAALTNDSRIRLQKKGVQMDQMNLRKGVKVR